MRKEVVLQQIERRMIELGCPERKLRKKLEDFDLHHTFLKHTAIKEHLSEEAAEAQASMQLGNPVALAEEAATSVRQASWWGRHRILGFIVFPIVSLGPALGATILFAVIVGLLAMTQSQWQDYGSGIRSISEVRHLANLFFDLQYLVLTLFAIPFAWMARRSGAGPGWATVSCLIYGCQGMFLQLQIGQRQGPPFHYFFATPNWLGALGPALVAAAAWYRHWQRLQRSEPLPDHLQKLRSSSTIIELLNKPMGSGEPKKPTAASLSAAKTTAEGPNWFVKALRTPTYWAVVIVPVVFVLFVMVVGRIQNRASRQRAIAQQNARNNNNDSPGDRDAERADAIQQIKLRQSTNETHNETVINLQPHINVQLEESVDVRKGLKDNNLGELPRGEHIYGGVPFDVEGRVQLMGRGLERGDRVFPAAVKDIRIGRKCAKIHLFHGATMANPAGRAVAKLILHYTDGSEETIEIITGEHLLDWWGPIYTTGAPKNRRELGSPEAELAWVGSNPFIKSSRPDESLRLYKATFDNPHPNVEVSTIEYVSTMTQAAPFMLGMTVE